MVWRRPVTTALVALTLLDACGGGAATGSGAKSAHGSATSIASRRLDDRPPLVLVRRDGDPSPAVAFAVTTDTPLAAAATSAALRARLATRGFSVRLQPNALGFALSALVPNAQEARRFVQVVGAVLELPFAANDAALEAVRSSLAALSTTRAPGPAEATVAACSGELALGDTAKTWDPASEKGRHELAAWFKAARAVHRAAFAVVGPPSVLTAVEDALAQGSAWPDGSALDDPWPARDELGTDFTANASHRLSLAVRLPNEDTAARAARALAAPGSALQRRLSALRPEWRLDRTLAIGRPRGACLRLDVVPTHSEVGPSATDVARALTVVAEESRAFGAAPGRGELDEAIAGATHPGDAAAAAAWRALVGRDEPGPVRTAVSYSATPAERGRFELAAAVSAERQAEKEPFIEVARRAEPGQGRLWALFAPTCGTSVESAASAGESALVVTALARSAPEGEVTVEPWLAPDGAGLLVGTRRLTPAETTAAQATRLGRALGELVATARPTPTDLASAREELTSGLGGEQHRGYFVALDALTQGHPSWLEPRGTFAALASAPTGGFEAALQRWLGRPLRVAVLANGDATQPDSIRREIERWLRPIRGDAARCPSRNHPASPTTELTLSVSGDAPEGSYVGIPFPPFERRLPVEARAALVLLNRSGGWLDQVLSDLPASATALALGGPDAAAFVVEVVTTESQRHLAVERLRQLFERLATGRVATQADVDLARRELAQGEAGELLDPRRRVVATFRGATKPEPVLDASRLAAFLATLRRGGTVVVHVASRG